MKRIFIVHTPSDISRAVRTVKREPKDTGAFFCAQGRQEARLVQKCIDSGLQKIKIDPYSTNEREKFLQEYIDVIGKLSNHCTSPWWWGTDIASRNRFASRIPDLLQEFLTVLRSIEKSKSDIIVVIKPSWTIVQSLARAAALAGYEFRSSIRTWQYWWYAVHAWFHYVGSLASETMSLIGRIWEVRDGISLRRWLADRNDEIQNYYILKTFLYNASAFGEDGTYRDAFFGTLPNYLKEQGHAPLLYVRILGDYKKCIQRIRKFFSFPIIPFEALLTPLDIWKAITVVFFPRIHIRQRILFLGHDVTDIVVHELHRTHNGLTLTTVLHYFATKRLFYIVPSDTYTFTYEGNPWERMCIQAIRDTSPTTQIIGYSHTVVPPAAAGMFPSVYERSTMPQTDKVLTIGSVTKNLLERYGAYKEGSVQTACALRLEYLRGLQPYLRNQKKHILIALEGVTPVYQLAHYVLRELWDTQGYEVRFRSHPVLGLHDLTELLSFDIAHLPAHIHESRGTSLTEDIQWAGVVMYWGSTVGLEALALGRPVIHYQNDSLLNYDSLFDCSALKWVATDHISLQAVLEEILSMPEGEYEDKKKKVHEYLVAYIHPTNEETLKRFF